MLSNQLIWKRKHTVSQITLPVIHIYLEPRKNAVYTCPVCGKRVPKYDTQYESRKWRVMDILGHVTYVHSPLPRLHCSQHSIITASVPWAFHISKFSEDFEFYVAWLACYLTKTAAATLALVDWHTVGAILSRIRNRVEPHLKDRLNNMKIIGVDETSYKKGHKYITTVVNLETNEVVWISEGHGKSVFSAFFRELTEDQKKRLPQLLVTEPNGLMNALPSLYRLLRDVLIHFM